MALIKSVAGYFKEIEIRYPVLDLEGNLVADEKGEQLFSYGRERVWIPQRDLEMHPLEEKETLARWAVGDIERKFPIPFTDKQEKDWLIEHDVDFVRRKRAEQQAQRDALMPEYKTANDYLKQCSQEVVDAINKGELDPYQDKDTHEMTHLNARIDEINQQTLARMTEIKAHIQRVNDEKIQHEQLQAHREAEALAEQERIKEEALRLKAEKEAENG